MEGWSSLSSEMFGVAEYWDDFGAPRRHGDRETRGLWFVLSDKIIPQLCNAINILDAGQAVSVCGTTVRPEGSKSRKARATKQKTPTTYGARIQRCHASAASGGCQVRGRASFWS
ncbi:MAG: hypothetical protein F6K24_32050 [Okeania sp. SIO2D1]|nr:hypothetical protein [Okeania sp. SIO2D1]